MQRERSTGQTGEGVGGTTRASVPDWCGRVLRTLACALLATVAGCGTSGGFLSAPGGNVLDLSDRREMQTLRKQVEKDPFPSADTALKRVNLAVQ